MGVNRTQKEYIELKVTIDATKEGVNTILIKMIDVHIGQENVRVVLIVANIKRLVNLNSRKDND